MGIKRGIYQPQKDWRDAKETAPLREFIHGRACECHSRGGDTVLVGWGGDRRDLPTCWWKFTFWVMFFFVVVVVCKGWSSFLKKKTVYRVSGRCEVRLSNADLSWFISLMAGTKDIILWISLQFKSSLPNQNTTTKLYPSNENRAPSCLGHRPGIKNYTVKLGIIS